jgi:hypothetical protein
MFRLVSAALVVSAAAFAEEGDHHECGDDRPALAISISAPPQFIQSRPTTVRVAVTALCGGDEAAKVTVSLADGRTPLGRKKIRVPAGSTVSASFIVTLTRLGAHTLTAQVGHGEDDDEEDRSPRASLSVQVVLDTVTASIGAGGGTITSPGGASLQIPFGALDSATTITITATTLAPPSGIGAVGPVFQFDPMGTLFARPVTISLPLPAGVSDGSIYCSGLGAGFAPIGGTVVNGVISVLVGDTPYLGQCVVGAKVTVRTVTGVGKVTWLSATTRVSIPIDFAGQGVEAVLSDGTHLAGTAGTGAAVGTFTIANVPIGKYMLHSGQQYLVTSTNTPDLGSVRGGRPIDQRLPLTKPTILNLTVNGMLPFDPNGWLEFYSTEANDWDFNAERFGNVNAGDTAAALAIDLTQLETGQGYAIQASKGDHALIAQLTTRKSSTNVPYLAMTRAAPIPSFGDLLDGQQASATVNLVDVSLGNTIAVDYRGTQFVNALNQDGNPNHVMVCDWCGGLVSVLAQAADAQDGFYADNAEPLILNDFTATGADIVTGVMQYGAPSNTTLPGSWGLLFDSRWTARFFIDPLPGSRGLGGGGTAIGFADRIRWITTPGAAQAAGPIGPILTLPRALTVGGIGSYAGGQNVGATPTLSWTAPRIGSPSFYSIIVKQIFVNPQNLRTAARWVASIVTPDTSFTLPPGILQAGQGYVFTVGAKQPTSAAAAQAANAPFKSAIDIADSGTTSNVFWTGAAPPPNPMVATTVQANQSFPWGLTATSSAIYWTERVDNPWNGSPDSGQGKIWTAGLDGSNPHVIASGQHQPMGVAADAGAVYWTNQGNGTVMKLALASNVISTVATGQGNPATAILDVNGSLFWSGAGFQALYAGSTTPAFLGWYGGVHFASDGASLFWTEYGQSPPNATGQIRSMPLTGGTPLTLASGQPQAWDVQVQGGYVYWSDQAWQQPNKATLHRAPVGGGADQVLFTGNELLKNFAVDGQYVYFLNNRILYGVPVAGGTPRFLTPLPGDSGGCPQGDMAVQGKSVYWTDTCSQSVIRATWRN